MELVVVTAKTKIHLPVPVKVILGTSLREPLKSKVSTAVDGVDRSFGVVVDVVGEWLRVVHAHLSLRPEGSHTPELLGQVILNDLLVRLLGRPDWDAIILDVEKEVDVILAARLQRQFVDHSTDGQELVVAILVASPGTEDVGVARKLLLSDTTIRGCGVFVEAVLVLLVATLLSTCPAHLPVVDLLLPTPDLVSASLLRLVSHVEATFLARVRVTVGTEAAETIKALGVVEAKLLVRTEEGCSHVLGDAGVSVDIGGIDLLILIKVAGLDLVMLLQEGFRGKLVRIEGDRVHRGFLVILGHMRPLGLDVVLGVGALRVLDKVLLRHPVAIGYEVAYTTEETVQSEGGKLAMYPRSDDLS